MNDEFDEPWKEILDALLEEFTLFFHPDLHHRIEWSRGYESLEQELLRVTPQGMSDKQSVDKLFRVWERTGDERWLLIHVEVQSQRREEFPHRMFVYNTSIFLGFDRMPISLAVLADDSPSWRPTGFRIEDSGTRHEFTFRSVKLLDYAGREEELRTSTNPFAVVVDAHLGTQRTRGDKAERGEVKFAIARSLFQRGFSRERVNLIFRFLDWVMKLPPEINRIWWENQVPFIDIMTQEIMNARQAGLEAGLREGRQEGRQEALRNTIRRQLGLRFGEAGTRLVPRLDAIGDEERLLEISDLLVLGNTLEEIASRLPPG